MRKSRQVVLIEFNELCSALLLKWMQTGDLPNFERFYRHSQAFITKADEVDPQNLEPWIQWYSIHTGMPFAEHRVFNLTDGPLASHKDIWQVLADGGKTVFNCGSMNARQISGPGTTFLPDPWCASQTPHPEELASYYKVVSRMVQEYTNQDQRLSFLDTIEFLRFMLMHGLRLETITRIVRQLAQDVVTRGKTRWKRATVLDHLQFDVFRYYFRTRNPDFSTFFINSTAHYQHSYWRHMDPAAFNVKPPQGEIEQFGDAILFGYREMDRLLGEFLKLAGPETVLIFASGISQQPFLRHESVSGQRFFRPHSIESLLAILGIDVVGAQPVMTHQYLLRLASPTAKEAALARLGSVHVAGKPLFGFSQADDHSIFFGVGLVSSPPLGSRVRIDDRDYDFADLFYQIDVAKSGCHHPDGVLWIKTGSHAVVEAKASILDIFPTVLDLMNVTIVGELRGKSLAPALR